MAVVSFSKAARLVGVSRDTLLQVIDNGKLPTVEMEEGRRGVDTTELERVYGFLLSDSVADTTIINVISSTPSTPAQSDPLNAQIEAVRAQTQAAWERQERLLSAQQNQRQGRWIAALVVVLATGAAVAYQFWPGAVTLEPPAVVNTPPPPEPTETTLVEEDLSIAEAAPVPDPLPPTETTGYIDDLMLEPPTPPATEPEVRTLSNPQVIPAGGSVTDHAPADDAPEVTTTEAPPAVEGELAAFLQRLEPGEFVVVVGSFSSAESARSARDRLRRQHPELFQPTLSPTSGNTAGYENYYQRGRFWVVYIGDFYSRASAERLRQRAVSELGMRDDSFLQRPL